VKLKREAAQTLTAVTDSADVTLASQDSKPKQIFCKFHQRGHCKFGEHCKHFHTQHTCTHALCEDSTCTARHPRLCRYYSQSGYCKFGTSCSYLHQVLLSEKSDVEQLKIKLQQVIDSLKIKETEIKKLDEKVNLLEGTLEQLKTHKMEEVPQEPKSFKCDHCAYTASSPTALKSHTTKKHKVSSFPSPEILLSSGFENESRCLSPEKDTPRAADLSTTIDKHKHLDFSEFMSEDQPETCHFCDETFDNTETFKNHMVNFHELPQDLSECSDCERSFNDLSKIAQYVVCIDGIVAARCLQCRDFAILNIF
jgi:FtsZ-binding cell division protein ZapB